MTEFKKFQNDIKKLGGVWATDDVYFSQFRDSYSASYKPKFPHSTLDDMIISEVSRTGAYLRGNYELDIYDGFKFTAIYYNQLDEMKHHFNKK